jgi:hypothetical protein
MGRPHRGVSTTSSKGKLRQVRVHAGDPPPSLAGNCAIHSAGHVQYAAGLIEMRYPN